ncbi:hypothetical protein HPB49_001719 [Dermacentor silvarum]|uniref:Uncharacterized protein n=1 Tax=Dermacentor silvarum TaxID=543639 RepID=A0ACB8CUN8_DERSI|nr:hypothetical protein HPB49_001719 [Dermacentor silvarum]
MLRRPTLPKLPKLPRPVRNLASSPKPPHHSGNATSEAANPNARNAAHDATAATRSGKTPARLPPATKETRLTVQRSKQLPPLPPNAIRVVVRPRGELRLLDVPTPRLTKAVQTQLRITLPDDFCLHTHSTNNTFTMATIHSQTAETLKTLTSLAIGDQTYPCTAYVAPPPGSTRGVLTNAYDDETPTQLYQDLVRRNPQYTILAARRMGKTLSILITFHANAVPHSIKYMGAIHRCTLYRGSPDACTNCRQPGHRHDVMPKSQDQSLPPPNQHKSSLHRAIETSLEHTPFFSQAHDIHDSESQFTTRPGEIPGGGSGGQSRSYSSPSRSRRSSAMHRQTGSPDKVLLPLDLPFHLPPLQPHLNLLPLTHPTTIPCPATPTLLPLLIR